MLSPSTFSGLAPQSVTMPRLDSAIPMKDMLSMFSPASSQPSSTSAVAPPDATGAAELLGESSPLKGILDQIKELGVDPSSLSMSGSRSSLKFTFSYQEETLRMDSSGNLDYQSRSLDLDLSISSFQGDMKANGKSTGVEGFRLKLQLSMEELTMSRQGGTDAGESGDQSGQAAGTPAADQANPMASLQAIIDKLFGSGAQLSSDESTDPAQGGAADKMLSGIQDMADATRELATKVIDILKKLNDLMEQLKKKSSESSGLYDRNGMTDGRKQASGSLNGLMLSFKLEVKSLEFFRSGSSADSAAAADTSTATGSAVEDIAPVAPAVEPPIDTTTVKTDKAEAKADKTETKADKKTESKSDDTASEKLSPASNKSESGISALKKST